MNLNPRHRMSISRLPSWRILSLAFCSGALFFTSGVLAQTYTFTTWAGYAGYGSADGITNTARFYNPAGVALDSSGSLYLADQRNHVIRKITSGGIVSTLAGLAEVFGTNDSVGSDARFNNPTGTAVDRAGNVYVADFLNHTI